MYILLRKEKDYYYECVARSREAPPNSRGFYNYEHALFRLNGELIQFNNKMRPSLVDYTQQTIQNKSKKNSERKLSWLQKLNLKRKLVKHHTN